MTYLNHPYWLYGIWEMHELDMPRLVGEILNCVVYLYPSVDAAQSSKNTGGSGFIVGVVSKVNPSKFTPYVVTNAHVINGKNLTIRINNKDGTMSCIATSDKDWVRSKDSDIAVALLSDETNGLDQKKHKIDFFVSDIMFADKKTVEEDDIGVGDDTFIVGRFQLADGKRQNTPTLRWGTIAQMPLEEITVNKQQSKVYLVECHSISGFSGSPVFVYIDRGTIRPKSEYISPGEMNAYFLGVDCGHLPLTERVKERRLVGINEFKYEDWFNSKDLKVAANSAMMAVAPAWKLRELLDTKEFVLAREQGDDEMQQEVGQTPDDERVIPGSLPLRA